MKTLTEKFDTLPQVLRVLLYNVTSAITALLALDLQDGVLNFEPAQYIAVVFAGVGVTLTWISKEYFKDE